MAIHLAREIPKGISTANGSLSSRQTITVFSCGWWKTAHADNPLRSSARKAPPTKNRYKGVWNVNQEPSVLESFGWDHVAVTTWVLRLAMRQGWRIGWKRLGIWIRVSYRKWFTTRRVGQDVGFAGSEWVIVIRFRSGWWKRWHRALLMLAHDK